ncbi:GNAT family N-acetyltransferase [Streptomyces sp. NPDC020096]
MPRAQLTDPQLQRMVAVSGKYHYDRGYFDQHWAKVSSDPVVIVRTVLADGVVAGYAAVFGSPSVREVTYALGRPYWGHGIATAALAELIKLEPALVRLRALPDRHRPGVGPVRRG